VRFDNTKLNEGADIAFDGSEFVSYEEAPMLIVSGTAAEFEEYTFEELGHLKIPLDLIKEVISAQSRK
jgi:hypothetical protein